MKEPLNVVLHAHSDWSYDGHWTLTQIAEFFGARGVDVVMMSEHDTGFDPERFGEYREACKRASNTRCSLVPGIEYSSPDNDIHILTWGLDHFLAEHRPVIETIRRVKELQGVSVFAHPVRRDAYQKFDDAFIPYLNGIEVWNRKSDGLSPGEEAKKLVARTGLAPTVGVDFHHIRHYWPLTHKVEVAGVDLERELVGAIRENALDPLIAGKRIRTAQDGISTPFSDTLEKARRGLKRLRPGSKKGTSKRKSGDRV